MTNKYKNNEERIPLFSIWFLNEVDLSFSYEEIDKKGPRPFLILKQLKNNNFLIAKISTCKKTKYQNFAKHLFKITIKNKESVIDLSDLYILNFNEINQFGYKTLIRFTKSEREKINLILANFLIGQESTNSIKNVEIETEIIETTNDIPDEINI